MPSSTQSTPNLIRLRDLLKTRFNEDELRSLCFEINMDYADLPGQGKTRKIEELIGYFERKIDIPQLVERLQRERPYIDWRKEVYGSPGQNIPFTNRRDEIDSILSSYAPPYYLIDAPAGYGKTELLKELERRFEEKGWVCAYASVNEHGTLAELAQALAHQLRSGGDVAQGQSVTQLADQLVANIDLNTIKSFESGFVLLIDLEGRPCSSILPDLLDKFIPAIQKSLSFIVYFREHHNCFRVVIAGRHLASQRAIRQSSFTLAVRRLTPFTYEIIQDTAKDYLKDRNLAEEVLAQAVADFIYHTGGHPGCVARVLEMYKTAPVIQPDFFLNQYGQAIWETVVRNVVEDVRNGIHSEPLRVTLDNLCVLRCVDYVALQYLFQGAEVFDLADELTGTFLLDRKGRLLRDDITRRLLAIRLRWELGDKEFAQRCQNAQHICASRLQDRNAHDPQMWAIEYLFQVLQKQPPALIHDLRLRRDICRDFLAELPRALHMLVDPRNKREERDPLKQALEEDWEFRFMVNYYLREGCYSNQPYEHLLRQIDAFFT